MNEHVYVHQRFRLVMGQRGAMVEMVRSRWAPHVERRHGVRLAGIWATAGSTGEWPEKRVQWELDDWDHFARAFSAQHPMEERDTYLTELWNQALDFRSRPGRMAEYHDALVSTYVARAEERGLRLLGAHAHAIVPNTGLTFWALPGWDEWRSLMERTTEPGTDAWNDGLGEWLAERELCDRGFTGEVFLHEIIHLPFDEVDRYLGNVDEQLLPVLGRYGMEMVGAFRVAMRPRQVVSILGAPQWADLAALLAATPEDPALRSFAEYRAGAVDHVDELFLIPARHDAFATGRGADR